MSFARGAGACYAREDSATLAHVISGVKRAASRFTQKVWPSFTSYQHCIIYLCGLQVLQLTHSTTKCGWFQPLLIIKAYDDKKRKCGPTDRAEHFLSNSKLISAQSWSNLLFTFGGFSLYMEKQA